MKRRWMRVRPGGRENALAVGVSLGVAAGVGLVCFYLARLFLSREELPPLEREEARRRAEPMPVPGEHGRAG